MTNNHRRLDTQHDTSLADSARSAPNGGFKRLALPAVAAAVQTLARAKSREEGQAEWRAQPHRDNRAD
jgi:hypothetical protein